VRVHWTKVSEKQVDGDLVEVFFEATESATVARTAHIVTVLRTAGYLAQDVILLGYKRLENSSIRNENAIGGWRIKDTLSAEAGELSYSTIHAFKGLERPIVIVIDAGGSAIDETDSLLYVAMSRARVRLFVVCPEEARERINQRITDWAKKQAMAGAR
jgi:superfamily I DNA and RNA helicase